MKLKELPIGARVRDFTSKSIFLVADHCHTGWKGTTLASDRIVLMSCIDAAEPYNPDAPAASGGSNRYRLSNIHQWLNSAETDWYRPAHPYDMPPAEAGISSRQNIFGSALFDHDATHPAPYAYNKMPGYLSRFSEGFRNALIENEIPCFGSQDPDIIHYGPPAAERVLCKAFLPSAAEIGLEDEIREEGFLIRLFQDPRMRMCAPENIAIHRGEDYDYKQSAIAFWLRSPVGGTTHLGKIYQVEHKFGDVVAGGVIPHPVNYAAGIRPVLNLSDDTEVGSREPDGVWNFLF